MARICFAFIAIATFWQAATGQSPETDWLQHVIPAKERSFDFQTVAKGGTPEHRFVLKNPLQEPLHIANVTSSCTCTTVDFDTEKSILQTYEEFVITVRLRGDMFEGQRNATLTVVIDEPNRAEIQLNIRGVIRTNLKVSPNFIDFGNVESENKPSRTLTVTYTGSNSQWRIVDTRCDNEFIRTDIIHDSSDIGQKVFKVNVSLDPSTPHGRIDSRLFLITNEAAGRREIPILIRATVGTVMSVSPPTLFLGSLPPGEPSPKKFAIVSGTKPFCITKIECDNPAVEISWDIDNNAPPKVRHIIPIFYRNPVDGEGSPKDGVMLAAVQITTDIPGLAPTTFYVTMSVQNNACEEQFTEP